MRGILDRTRALESSLASMKELLLGNVVLLGEVPSYAGTWQSQSEFTASRKVRAGLAGTWAQISANSR